MKETRGGGGGAGEAIWLTLDLHGDKQLTPRNCLKVEILLESRKEQIKHPPLAHLRGL